MKIFFLLIFLSALTVIAAEQPKVTTESDKSIVRSDKDIRIVQLPIDTSIENRVKKILVASELIQNPIVTSQEGIVTLRGVISKKSQSEWAEKIAADTEGVVAVLNKLEVKKGDLLDLSPAKNEAESLAHRFIAALPYIIASIIVLALFLSLAYIASKVGRKAARSRLTNPLLVELIAKLFALPLVLLGLYFVLRISGLTGMAFTVLGGTGALGLIIGFAMKNILENYFSGLMLSLSDPYIAGDTVRIAGYEGVVQRLTTRGTILIDNDGNHIIIPNSTILGDTIVNMSANPLTRLKFSIELDYDNSVADIRKVINEALLAVPDVLKDQPQLIILDELSKTGMKFTIYFWIDSRKSSAMKVKSLAMEIIKVRLCENDMAMAQTSFVMINKPVKEAKPVKAINDQIESQETEPEDQRVLQVASQGRPIVHGETLN